MAKLSKLKSGEVKESEEQIVLKHPSGRTVSVPIDRWEKHKASYTRERYKPATAEEIKATHEVETIIPQETTKMQEKGD